MPDSLLVLFVIVPAFLGGAAGALLFRRAHLIGMIVGFALGPALGMLSLWAITEYVDFDPPAPTSEAPDTPGRAPVAEEPTAASE